MHARVIVQVLHSIHVASRVVKVGHIIMVLTQCLWKLHSL